MIGVIEWEAAEVSDKRRTQLHARLPVTVTLVDPVTAIAASFFIRDQSAGMADQKELIWMLGLDMAPDQPAERKPRPQVRPNLYRRSTTSRKRR